MEKIHKYLYKCGCKSKIAYPGYLKNICEKHKQPAINRIIKCEDCPATITVGLKSRTTRCPSCRKTHRLKKCQKYNKNIRKRIKAGQHYPEKKSMGYDKKYDCAMFDYCSSRYFSVTPTGCQDCVRYQQIGG